MRALFFSAVLLILAMTSAQVVAAQTGGAPVRLGQSIVTLNGPWAFQVGDNARWAQPGFDDSGWSHVDLTPEPGATDGDVGLPNYVQGWTAKGHPGYHGYAWYRIRLNVAAPAGEKLALLGPWAVDSAYQVYANGALAGGIGDFSGATPVAHGYHYPLMIELPAQSAHGDLVVAIRVWMGPWGGAGSGGIHIAPAIGTADAVAAQYKSEWLKIFEGYGVDVVPALLFFLAAAMALCMIPFAPDDTAYRWLAFALALSGIQRGNQAFFFWWQIETIQQFVVIIAAIIGSLSLGAWMMAWRAWFRLEQPLWLPRVIVALTLAHMLVQLSGRPWLFGTTFPPGVIATVRYLITGLHWAFVAVLAFIVWCGVRRQGREAWFALPAVLAISVVLFVGEFVALGLPGIWFPWGVGVSVSECASVVGVLLLFALLLRRLWSFAPRRARVAASSHGAV
ncbi:MAG: glycoside hydrolase [Rhizomicrobium sp.]